MSLWNHLGRLLLQRAQVQEIFLARLRLVGGQRDSDLGGRARLSGCLEGAVGHDLVVHLE